MLYTLGRKMIRPLSTALFFLSFLLYGKQRSELLLVTSCSTLCLVYMLLVSAFYSQVKEYGTVPAGIHRKSPEHGSRIPTGKFSEFFPVTSERFQEERAGKWSECAGKKPEIFWPESCFRAPVFSCRIQRFFRSFPASSFGIQ